MNDEIRTLERAARKDPADASIAARLRAARIRAGLEEGPEVRTFRVLELNLTGLRKKVDSLAKRARKLGAIPLQLHVGEERHLERRGDVLLPARDVQVVGDAPDLGDWRLCARLEHLDEETVVREFEDTGGAAARFSKRGPVCDHCKVRRQRKDTFAVRHRENGEVLQVGRTCLREFTGADPKAALYVYDAEAILVEMAGRGDRMLERCRECKVDVEPVVTLESPHGTCPHCGRDLEGRALRTSMVPLARYLIALADPAERRSPWRAFGYASSANPDFTAGWDAERLSVAGDRAIAAVAWAQGREGNEAAVLRDAYVEMRHVEIAAEGYRLSRLEAARAERDSGDLPVARFAWIRRTGEWGLRGEATALVPGARVIGRRKSGHEEVKEIVGVAVTLGNEVIATFRDA